MIDQLPKQGGGQSLPFRGSIDTPPPAPKNISHSRGTACSLRGRTTRCTLAGTVGLSPMRQCFYSRRLLDLQAGSDTGRSACRSLILACNLASKDDGTHDSNKSATWSLSEARKPDLETSIAVPMPEASDASPELDVEASAAEPLVPEPDVPTTPANMPAASREQVDDLEIPPFLDRRPPKSPLGGAPVGVGPDPSHHLTMKPR